VLSLVCVLAFAAGCGGGSNGATSAGTRSTADAGGRFSVATADAICARRNRELAGISEAGEGLPARAAAARKRATVQQRALGELERLTPPASIAGEYRELIDVDRVELQKLVRLRERSQAGDAEGVRLVTSQIGSKRLRLLVVGTRIGLRDCSGID
jgi:hypothetical protein